MKLYEKLTFLLFVIISSLIIIFLSKYNEFTRPNPLMLQEYMRGNIKYSLEYEKDIESDYFQSPEETMRVKEGDCDDMAILTNNILTKWGYKSKVYFLIFKELTEGHAVTVFKGVVGYNMFDNQFLRYTLKQTPIECIKELYPDAMYIYEINLTRYGYTTMTLFENDSRLVYDEEEVLWETKYKYFKR